MEDQKRHQNDLFRFDYATYDLKEFVGIVSEINELLLRVNPALAEKGVFTLKRKTEFPSVGMQIHK